MLQFYKYKRKGAAYIQVVPAYEIQTQFYKASRSAWVWQLAWPDCDLRVDSSSLDGFLQRLVA